MSDTTPSDDLRHLPTADVDEARAAKAALWKEIANRKKQSRLALDEPPPVEEPAAPESAPPAHASSSDEWAELFAMNPEEAAAMSVPLPAAPSPVAKKRSVIRRSTPLVMPNEEPLAPEPPAEPEPIIQQEVIVEPPARPEPTPRVESKQEEPISPPMSEDKVDATTDTTTTDTDKAKEPVQAPPKTTEGESDAAGAEVHFLIALMRQKWVQWGGPHSR